MNVRLHELYSPDLPAGYGQMPPDPDCCWIRVHADIGSESGTGADCFTVYVTTPAFLANSLVGEKYQLGRGLLLVAKFDWDVVEEAVRAVCGSVSGTEWRDLAAQLSRHFYYEYE